MADHDADAGYLLDNQQSEAGIRFGALAELFDPVTFRHVDRLGIGAGMRCWEIGAGGPTVPLGLAARVAPGGPAQRLANRLRSGFRALMAARGADLAYGRTLPRLLREAGLDDVRADAYFPIASPACTVLEAATVRQIRGRLVAAGLATDDDIDQHLANVATGRLDLATAPMISAWGRRPPAARPA
ncbi:hypothetical protein GA0115240_129416 [Streptomyces sp. DvalAA-14]|uniref:hypothetical protein n=1 Tax=unclassified Streptomyces TaxID=2593676 RepID=UPI00081B1774|nr:MULTISPECIES: hypothetical protein [unclassified Streptomyces]MYS21379.1 hypothetical protein [Streptomyces sp. SID4948]SCD91037.1 hypothetical protein GA0115240_129416 [Streptomyces sp. DvalAA-14]